MCIKDCNSDIQRVIVLKSTSLAAAIGLLVNDIPGIFKLCPSATHFKMLTINCASEVVVWMIKHLKGKKPGLVYDKGEDHGKNASLLNLLTNYDENLIKLRYNTLMF